MSNISPSPFDLWRGNKEANRLYQIILTCTRTEHAAYVVFYLKQADSIQKIGQFPSVADFQIPETTKYRKLLGEQQYKEFTRGLGLAAHGVGIGSFVYLRRIFENLVEEAHTAAQQDAGFDEDKYRNARMDEKIEMLRHHLPSFLVENKSIYGILSKGIHELTETECLGWFEPVRLGIELVLDEKFEQADKRKKVQQAQAEIRENLSANKIVERVPREGGVPQLSMIWGVGKFQSLEQLRGFARGPLCTVVKTNRDILVAESARQIFAACRRAQSDQKRRAAFIEIFDKSYLL